MTGFMSNTSQDFFYNTVSVNVTHNATLYTVILNHKMFSCTVIGCFCLS